MFTVIGIQKVDFKAQDGNVIKGTKLYLTFDKDYVDGKACETIFVKESISLVGIEVGDLITVNYNKFGKVQDVKLVSIL